MDTNKNGEAFADAINNQIRAEIAAAHTTIKEVAELSGISYFTIRRYMSGEREMPLKTFSALCDALDIDISTVVKRALERTPRDP